MSIASIGITLIEILPKIFQVIQTVELATKEQTEANPTGNQKLIFALSLLETYYETTNPKIPFKEMQGAITKVIATVVSFYKEIKVFTSKKVNAENLPF